MNLEVKASERQERRRHRRLRLGEVESSVSVHDQSFPCSIENLSSGGACLRLSEDLAQGSLVLLSFTPQGWETPLRLPARVLASRNTAGNDISRILAHLKFGVLTAEPASQLMRLIHSLSAVRPSPPPPIPSEQLASAEQRTILDLGLHARLAWSPEAARPPPPVQEEHSGGEDESPLRQRIRELKTLLASRDQQLAATTFELSQCKEALAKAEKERDSAQLALKRLITQLAAKR